MIEVDEKKEYTRCEQGEKIGYHVGILFDGKKRNINNELTVIG